MKITDPFEGIRSLVENIQFQVLFLIATVLINKSLNAEDPKTNPKYEIILKLQEFMGKLQNYHIVISFLGLVPQILINALFKRSKQN